MEEGAVSSRRGDLVLAAALVDTLERVLVELDTDLVSDDLVFELGELRAALEVVIERATGA
ncbi:MAG: hypothetical protein JO186_11415 [Actinobacteria bacterium]|nr:hypothetical protein [Actinomycetota bacterium]MBV8395087.1 hypothetical protein [Actinomycetota bacterium]